MSMTIDAWNEFAVPALLAVIMLVPMIVIGMSRRRRQRPRGRFDGQPGVSAFDRATRRLLG
jgi:hypothetical protein